jgi:hypothetical protein
MYLIFLEALGAGLILVLIVWWTMFTGRPRADQASSDESVGESAALEKTESNASIK